MVSHIRSSLDWNSLLCFGATNTRYRDIVAPYLDGGLGPTFVYDSTTCDEIFNVFGSYFTIISLVSEQYIGLDRGFNGDWLGTDDNDLLQKYQTSTANIIDNVNAHGTPRLRYVSFVHTIIFQWRLIDFYNSSFDEFYKLICQINDNCFLNLRRGNLRFQHLVNPSSIDLMLTISF